MTKEEYEKYMQTIDCCFHCNGPIEPGHSMYVLMAGVAAQSDSTGPAIMFHGDCFIEIAGQDYTFNWDFSKEKWNYDGRGR